MSSTNQHIHKLECGFTLIEIMAVVLIIGLALGLGLRIDLQDFSVETKNEGKRFANAAAVVLEESVLSGDPWGIDFYQTGNVYGYRWVHFLEGQWQVDSPTGIDEIQPHFELAVEYDLAVEIESIPMDLPRLLKSELTIVSEGEYSPAVLLTPDHQTIPFTMTISNDQTQTVSVGSDLLGRFRIVE